MKRYEATRLLKKVLIIGGIVSAVGGFIVGVVYGTYVDHVNDERALCAPDRMEHAFLYDSHTRATCIKDGKLYLSDKVR